MEIYMEYPQDFFGSAPSTAITPNHEYSLPLPRLNPAAITPDRCTLSSLTIRVNPLGNHKPRLSSLPEPHRLRAGVADVTVKRERLGIE